MRDLFGYRWAFRCTTDSSSDVVLGQGWAAEGYTAADIDPLARGVGWLLSETGIPRRIKAAYLDDDTIKYLAAYAARLRHGDRRMSPVHALNGHDTTSHPARSWQAGHCQDHVDTKPRRAAGGERRVRRVRPPRPARLRPPRR